MITTWANNKVKRDLLKLCCVLKLFCVLKLCCVLKRCCVLNLCCVPCHHRLRDMQFGMTDAIHATLGASPSVHAPSPSLSPSAPSLVHAFPQPQVQSNTAA